MATRKKSGGGESLRAIPADHEAERAVLGAILLDHAALYKVEDQLRPDSFDDPRHRVLYEAFLELRQRQQAITLITLRNLLSERGVLEELGGVTYLSGLADTTPTAAHVEHHAAVVREKALSRSLIRTCEELAARGYEADEPVSRLVEDAEKRILHIAMGHVRVGFSGLRDEMDDTMDFVQRVQEGRVAGKRTHFADIDKLTGGFEGGDLVVIAARPSMGKTALALNLARNHAVEDGGCVGIFSLEMTKRQLILRLLMSEASLDFSRFRGGLFDERELARLTRAAAKLETARIFIDDSALLTSSDISAKARRLQREQEVSLLVVDYIQLIQGSGRADWRQQDVAEISRSLKLLAKDLDIPIVALSQLNRAVETRPTKRPLLADLRESGAIEQDADIVMFIYRDEVYNEDSDDRGIAEINVAKQRNGPTGIVRLQFEARHARFHNLAGQPPPPESGFGGPDFDDLDGARGGMESPFE